MSVCVSCSSLGVVRRASRGGLGMRYIGYRIQASQRHEWSTTRSDGHRVQPVSPTTHPKIKEGANSRRGKKYPDMFNRRLFLHRGHMWGLIQKKEKKKGEDYKSER